MAMIPPKVVEDLIAEGMPRDADRVTQMMWLRKVSAQRAEQKAKHVAQAHAVLDQMENDAFNTAKEVVGKMSDEKIAEELTPRVILEHLMALRIFTQSFQKRDALLAERFDRVEELDKLWLSYLAEGQKEG